MRGRRTPSVYVRPNPRAADSRSANALQTGLRIRTVRVHTSPSSTSVVRADALPTRVKLPSCPDWVSELARVRWYGEV